MAARSFGLALVAGGAWAAGPPVSDLDVIRGTDKTTPFALAIGPRTFSFPEDHGPHPQFRHEWWYLTGNLDSAGGERFGFELIFFRFGLAPPGAVGSGATAGTLAGGGTATGEGAATGGTVGLGVGRSDRVSAWRTRQAYLAHFAITDVARREFRFAHRYSRDALGLAGAQAQPLRVWLDDWTFGQAADIGGASNAPGHVSSATGAPWTLHAQDQGYELTLELQPLNQPVLNGEQGLSRKASERGAASYYYSIPRVAVRGKLLRAGVSSDVQGLAWLDREWGSGSLGASEQGWDWFALQLRDGSSFMFYALRNRDGTRDSHSAGTWVDPAGRVQALSTDQVMIDVRDHWVSPRGGRYPSRWRVRVPSVRLDIEARPILANQELGTKPRYWEGAVDVSGTQGGHDASGRGYVELVGYAE
ncbi:MAG: lipocalin-like domain-containing protein [Steroidobacteraceae bacterium]